MDPYLTDEHLRLRAEVAEFARERIQPVASELDRDSRFPWENVKVMAEMGLLGIPIPEELGGMGRDYLSYVMVVEELARYDASHAITVSAHTTLGTMPIVEFGSREQKERWVPSLARGRVLGGFGLTETGAGSDASSSRTRADRERGGWRLNGSKIFITHAGVGEIFTVTAVTEMTAAERERAVGPTGPGDGAGEAAAAGDGPVDGEAAGGGRRRAITNFVVTKPTTDLEIAEDLGVGHDPDLEFVDGVRAGKKEDKMGWRASDTRELLLEDVWIPDENRLGVVGRGFVNFMKTLDAGRIGIAALSLGLAEGALDTAFRYSHDRLQFGRRIWEFQPVQFRIAELETDIRAGRHLTYHAAWLRQQGRPYTKEAAMAKLFCSELSMRATGAAIRILGGVGYTDAYPVERMMRDAKVCEIGEGTSEIQKLVIGREMVRETFGDAAM